MPDPKMPSTLEIYDVDRELCEEERGPVSFICSSCGRDGTDRLLMVTTAYSTILLCYDGCVQEFVMVARVLAIPEVTWGVPDAK